MDALKSLMYCNLCQEMVPEEHFLKVSHAGRYHDAGIDEWRRYQSVARRVRSRYLIHNPMAELLWKDQRDQRYIRNLTPAFVSDTMSLRVTARRRA